MPFEAFIYNGASTPNRLYAMLCLIAKQGEMARSQIIQLMQPESIAANQVMATDIFRTLELLGFIEASSNRNRSAQLAIDIDLLDSVETFRNVLQERVGGVATEEADHFILNQFAAWYAIQDNGVFSMSRSDYEAKFHEQLYPGIEKRLVTSAQSIPAWTSWAEFVGWGWQLRSGQQETTLIPDCTIRLRPLLGELLPETDAILFGVFMERLAARCPELDGGALFERCWEASRPYERRGNRLSLMLSTALRVLHQQGEIALEDRADATDNWTLFPAQSYIARATHIRREVNP